MKLTPLDGSLVRRVTAHKAFLPVTIFVILLVVLLISTTLSDRPPSIETINPQVGYPGSILLIRGNNFGGSRGTAEVVIAGIRPTTAAYLEWSNKRISVRVPSDVDSGMVYVQRNNVRSNGKLFTNRNNIPVVVKTSAAPGEPQIAGISPASGPVGTKITITGRNFGASRGTSKVYFTPIAASDQGIQVSDLSAKERFSGCGCDYNYDSWNDSQIVLYVPDGASSGNITVVTDRGSSNSQYFEVTNKVGTKTYKEKRGYEIRYGVRVSNVNAATGASIDLWLPGLSHALTQRHVESIVEPKPMWSDYKGLIRVHLTGFKPNGTYPVSATDYFDRYDIETRIDPTKVRDNYLTERELYKVYTEANQLVPADNPTVLQVEQQVVGSRKNPYDRARLLYDYVIQKMRYSAASTGNDVVAALKSGSGDSYLMALVYAALLRASAIPARPVAGVLVYGDKQTVNHYWDEFFLPDFGWVPVDPSLGAGARFGGFPNRSDVADYYFGNLDNQHITFTEGLVAVDKLEPNANTAVRSRSYSFQTVNEEATATVKSYDAIWDDVRVIDWW